MFDVMDFREVLRLAAMGVAASHCVDVSSFGCIDLGEEVDELCGYAMDLGKAMLRASGEIDSLLGSSDPCLWRDRLEGLPFEIGYAIETKRVNLALSDCILYQVLSHPDFERVANDMYFEVWEADFVSGLSNDFDISQEIA